MDDTPIKVVKLSLFALDGETETMVTKVVVAFEKVAVERSRVVIVDDLSVEITVVARQRATSVVMTGRVTVVKITTRDDVATKVVAKDNEIVKAVSVIKNTVDANHDELDRVHPVSVVKVRSLRIVMVEATMVYCQSITIPIV